TPSCGHTDHDRSDDEASKQDQRQRNEDARYGNAGFQQIKGKERGAAVQRDRMNAVMQIEKIDGAVAKERHGMPRGQMTDRRERVTAASPLRGRQHRNDNSSQSIIRTHK